MRRIGQTPDRRAQPPRQPPPDRSPTAAERHPAEVGSDHSAFFACARTRAARAACTRASASAGLCGAAASAALGIDGSTAF